MDFESLSEPLPVSASNITRDFQEEPRALDPIVDSLPAEPVPSKSRASLQPAQVAAALKISVYEGFSAQTFVTLTGGVFLPAFALALGANNFYIGALAAIPFFANLFQLAGARRHVRRCVAVVDDRRGAGKHSRPIFWLAQRRH
jgi:hypothetical protein